MMYNCTFVYFQKSFGIEPICLNQVLPDELKPSFFKSNVLCYVVIGYYYRLLNGRTFLIYIKFLFAKRLSFYAFKYFPKHSL